MINRLLGHLDAITRHRDHRLLDLSVLSALSEISGADRARVLDLFHEQMAEAVVDALEVVAMMASVEELFE